MWWMLFMGLAGAECRPEGPDVRRRVREGGGVWTDRRTLMVADGPVDCREQVFWEDAQTRIVDIRAKIRRPDDTVHRVGMDRARRLARPDTGQPGWGLYLPEVMEGDRVTVDVRRRSVPTDWAPPDAVQDTTGLTVLEAHGEHNYAMGDGPPLEAFAGTDRGTLAVTHQTVSKAQVEVAAGRRWIGFPMGMVDGWCKAEIDNGAVNTVVSDRGCTVEMPALAPEARVKLAWGWTDGRPPVVGEWNAADAGTATWTVRGVELAHATHGQVTVEPVEGGVRFSRESPGEARVTYRVAAVDGEPVLSDRTAVISRIAEAALFASLPEPGLPLDFKGRVAEEGGLVLADDVLTLVRRQVVTGTLPGTAPLRPRKLISVRRSGWATPWEQALLLTRYLRQLKFDAVPMPVRPTSSGPAEPATPVGYTRAVVRLIFDDKTYWLDPSCDECVVGALPPELWGGQALDPDHTELPVGAQSRR